MAGAVSARLTAKEGRKFAFQVGIAFAVLGTISFWRHHHYPPRVMWTLAGLLLLAGLLVPGRLTGVHRAWMGLASAISKVTAPIMVGVVYFVVLTPIGLFMRLLGRNPLRHREHNGGFWVPAESGGRSNIENQF